MREEHAGIFREQGRGWVGGGEPRPRSTGGKAFGCCSKLSTPQWAGKQKSGEGEGESSRRDGGVGGRRGSRLARKIEKECEGMRVRRPIDGVQEAKQKGEIVQRADRGARQTGAKTDRAA